MTNIIQPFHLLLFALTGWLNRHQKTIIDYLIEEYRILKDQLEGQRLRFTDEQRIRLAVKANVLGRRALDEIETLVTPDTLLAWHRKFIAKKWTYPRKGPRRPRVAQEITDLVLCMARENISWCPSRILMQPSEDRHGEGRRRSGVQQRCRVPLLVRNDHPVSLYPRTGVFATDGNNP
ncbi:MAG: hypothetical protein GY792_08550, partial [Gammaproteobacteria bacterium]|nr:hypothetical protein [Gammaproteobacteria bacterium]